MGAEEVVVVVKVFTVEGADFLSAAGGGGGMWVEAGCLEVKLLSMSRESSGTDG